MKIANFKILIAALTLILSYISARKFQTKTKVDKNICPGRKKRQHPTLAKSFNGCGPEMLPDIMIKISGKIVPKEMTECCNGHDICYSTCVATEQHHKDCDDTMLKCLNDYAETKNFIKKPLIKMAAKAMYTLVKKVESPYWDAQKKYCHCS